MTDIDKLIESQQFENISKRERLQIQRERAKLEKNLGSISDLTRLPAAVFVVDVLKEHIAVAEARRLNIPIFAIVDTNSNPKLIDFPIPANDDASKSVALIVGTICEAIKEGIEERKLSKEIYEEVEVDETTRAVVEEDHYDEDIPKKTGKTKRTKLSDEEDGPRRRRTNVRKTPQTKNSINL